MPAASAPCAVHHLYSTPGHLLPACGVTPGPDGSEWHTGHDAGVLQAFSAQGSACCSLCLELSLSSPD
ncbi:hypothetical protein [Paenarthrobacter ureafaciens]|uniref:hypothetical protein n=1 Tax=Paenarthrobacter ureafaciens TaxID=37931 RepID=UPI001ED19D10|nr:hypothetical protein [Paenarthrobacter ureafaciens]